MAPRRTFARAKHLAQAGFSLIELMVAITILTILGAAAFAIFGGATDSAKAVAFIDNSAAVKSSAQLFKTQTGCFPANGRVLFDKAEAATTTANFCGTNLTNVWTKPFLDARPVDANGNILLDTLGAGVVMSFSRAAGGIGQE
jgi:prepilin-type N-terminal cleavage/methylation domain-containing protein